MSKAEMTRERILQATIQIAAQKGFANTRTAAIARQAGVSEGLIFKYFPTKGHLFALIIDNNFRRLQAGVERIIAATDLSASAKIQELVQYHFSFFSDERNIIHLVLGHSEQKSPIDLAAVFRHAFRPYVQLIIKILKEGIAAGEFRPLNGEVTAMAIIGSMQVVLFNRLLSEDRLDWEATSREVGAYILAGVRAGNEKQAGGNDYVPA